METKQLCHRLFPWGSCLSVSPHLLFIRDTQITDILHHKAMTHTHHLCIWNKKGWGKNNTHTHTLDRPGNTYVLTLLHPLQICVNYMHILYIWQNNLQCFHQLQNVHNTFKVPFSDHDRCAPHWVVLLSEWLRWRLPLWSDWFTSLYIR